MTSEADSSTDKANVCQKNNEQCGYGCGLDTVANKKNIGETMNVRMSWIHEILSAPDMTVKR